MNSKTLIARLYQKMLLIREFELRLADLYPTDAIKSPVHLSIGQEAIAVAICDPLEKTDFVSNTYRCHATYIAKGGDLNQMMAELFGKATGCARGKAGSMHLIDIANGIIGSSAVVGTTIPIATGYALAMKMKAYPAKQVVVAVFGDGGTEEGCFFESINFAALHQLPIIFVCENNRLAIHSPLEKRWATEKLCERVATYDIPTFKIEDGDVFAIRDTVSAAVKQIKTRGKGPIFIECAAYRWYEHVGPQDDHHEVYRDPALYEYWRTHDQLLRLRNLLETATLESIHASVHEQIKAAELFARESPYPDVSELTTHVYAS